MDRCSFLGRYLAGFLLLGVWLAAVAADPADHAKPGGDGADEDFDVLMRRSNNPVAMGKDGGKGGDAGVAREGGQEDETYRRFLINALMGLKQQQWGWMGATGGPQTQQSVYTVPPPTSQDQPPVPPQPQQPPPPPPQQAPPVSPQSPPPPPPPPQSPQPQMPSMCPQYSVMPQATPPPMQSFAEKLHPQFGQCVTVLLPSPAALPTYNSIGQSPVADPNVMQPIPGCRGGCGNGRPHTPRRPYY